MAARHQAVQIPDSERPRLALHQAYLVRWHGSPQVEVQVIDIMELSYILSKTRSHHRDRSSFDTNLNEDLEMFNPHLSEINTDLNIVKQQVQMAVEDSGIGVIEASDDDGDGAVVAFSRRPVSEAIQAIVLHLGKQLFDRGDNYYY